MRTLSRKLLDEQLGSLAYSFHILPISRGVHSMNPDRGSGHEFMYRGTFGTGDRVQCRASRSLPLKKDLQSAFASYFLAGHRCLPALPGRH